MTHLSFSEFTQTQLEPKTHQQDFPPTMFLRRQAIRAFPDGKFVATYKDFATNRTYAFPQIDCD
ncbi:MAG: hypothetical protein JW384_03388 [Nitrosomonadaceae bacterium]|nr:hypothetical protein [Nitrosomonadaceae bacterium]